jgi:hypothetical protein
MKRHVHFATPRNDVAKWQSTTQREPYPPGPIGIGVNFNTVGASGTGEKLVTDT